MCQLKLTVGFYNVYHRVRRRMTFQTSKVSGTITVSIIFIIFFPLSLPYFRLAVTSLLCFFEGFDPHSVDKKKSVYQPNPYFLIVRLYQLFEIH